MTHRELVRAIETADADSLVAYAAAGARIGALTAHTRPFCGGSLIASAPPLPLTRAIAVALDSAALDEIEAWFASHGVASAVETSDATDPAELDLLRARGYTQERAIAMLARDGGGTAGSPGSQAGVANGVTIETDADPELWAQTAFAGFGPMGPIGESGTDGSLALARAGAEIAGPTGRFLARIGGVPVGVGAVSGDARFAFLYSGSVIPAFRRRGAHRALLEARVVASPGRLVVMGSTPDSASYASALQAGFRHLYEKRLFVRPHP
jgi:hypothetical protein